MTAAQRSPAAIMWLGAAGLIAASILFAPVISGGWCADAPVSGASLCMTFQRSLVGIETNVWLWLASVAVVVAITAVALRRRRTTHRPESR